MTPDTLRAAAARWAARSDRFADGKAETCLDLARKLERYGSFASPAQAEYAGKLIGWLEPRAAGAMLPRVEALVRDRNLSLHLGDAKVCRFQSGAVAVVAPTFGGGTYGIIDPGGAFRRFKACPDRVLSTLLDVEARGVEAVREIGRATGRCCVCARMLTDPASIEAGIGPVCAERLA